MPAPSVLAASRIVLIAIVHCSVVSIVSASCTGSVDWKNGVFSVNCPSFRGVRSYSGDLELSWDAGDLDGVLHLTADDVYQPPVQYAPDAKRSAGHVTWPNDRQIRLALSSDDSPDGLFHEASFNTTFTMSVSRSRNNTGAQHDDGGLLFEVLPRSMQTGSFDRAIYFSLASTSATSSNISVEIGKMEYYYYQGTFGLYVSISPAPPPPNATPAKYTVWIGYDAVRHNLSVYVGDDGKPKPGQATLHAPLNISNVFAWSGSLGSCMGLYASKNRLLPSCQPVVYSWNLTVDKLMPSWLIYESRGRRRGVRWFMAIVLSLGLAAAAAAIVAAAACCLASRYRALAMKLKLSKTMQRLPGVPRELRYGDVKKATKNFHESMRLGNGGFGAVYKGAMIASADGDDGRRRLRYVEVAVKKFTRNEDRCYDDFLAEVAVINRLRHKNIVPLIGWCYKNGELLLIYHYMPNGSLDQHIFRDSNHSQHHPFLPWAARYNVIKDVAAGLHYVHHEYECVVLHRDIKASNVMLDAAFRGRLGDFGLARVVGADKNSFTDIGVAGTWGFIAPEYAVSHKATRQTDVYAFGVLVLEVVTGRRSLAAADDAFPLLADRVWWLHGEGRLLEAVDAELGAAGGFDAGDAASLLLLGLACSNPKPLDRPSMAEVVQVVSKSVPPPDVPLVKPAFVWPPEGDQLQLSDDDDFVETNHRDSDSSNIREEMESSDGVATGIRYSEITKRKSRNVVDANIARDIENCA